MKATTKPTLFLDDAIFNHLTDEVVEIDFTELGKPDFPIDSIVPQHFWIENRIELPDIPEWIRASAERAESIVAIPGLKLLDEKINFEVDTVNNSPFGYSEYVDGKIHLGAASGFNNESETLQTALITLKGRVELKNSQYPSEVRTNIWFSVPPKYTSLNPMTYYPNNTWAYVSLKVLDKTKVYRFLDFDGENLHLVNGFNIPINLFIPANTDYIDIKLTFGLVTNRDPNRCPYSGYELHTDSTKIIEFRINNDIFNVPADALRFRSSVEQWSIKRVLRVRNN